jgi:hypothetical protein
MIDTTPKQPHQDQNAYLTLAAALTLYAETGDMYGAAAIVILYVLAHFGLRFNCQRMEVKREEITAKHIADVGLLDDDAYDAEQQAHESNVIDLDREREIARQDTEGFPEGD